MGFPLPQQSNYRVGMRQDEPRGQMIEGSVWNMVDLIPEIDNAPAAKRGGWTYGSDNITLSNSAATYVTAGAYANFAAGAKLCAIDEDGELYTVSTSSNSVIDIGATFASLQNPVLHSEKLIIPAADGTTAPKYYDGVSTVGSLAGSPPAAKYAAVYKDRTVLAGVTANRTYVYFSGPADPTSWDTTDGWLSVLSPVTALAALPNALMVFQGTVTSRVRGSTPPPGTDMITDDPLFSIGCTDARSVAVSGGFCVFANPLGVYTSNGTAQPEDLTARAGLKRYWRSLLSSYSASTWTLTGGIFQNRYFITIMNGTSFVDCLVFDLANSFAYRLSNVEAACYISAVTVQEELYFGSRAEARLGKLSPIYTPVAATKNDADGTPVTWTLEYPYFRAWRRVRRGWRGATGQARWLQMYLGYDMRDAATDNPVLTVSYIKNTEDNYTALSKQFPESADYVRDRIHLRFLAEGCAFKIVQTNASSNTRVYTLEAENYAREASRP